MEKKMLWLGLTLMVVGLCSSGALAQTLGPSAAGLNAGQFRAGLDISSSQTGFDLKGKDIAIGNYSEYSGKTKVINENLIDRTPDEYQINDEMQNEMLFANIGYGIADKLEVYLLVGVSDLGFGQEADKYDLDYDFGSSDELAYGFGVKGTIFEDGNVKFGAQFQMTWSSFDGDMDPSNIYVYDAKKDMSASVDDAPGTFDIDYYQLKIAVGPTYKLNETISIYGGPFYQMIDGSLDFEHSGVQVNTVPANTIVETVTEKTSADITERSRYGVYVGAQINCGENIPLNIECQTNNESYLVGASIAWLF